MYRAMGNGLRCLFEANHRGESIYRDQARRYADNPAMLMWYLWDEPNEGQARELRDHNAWRHAFDKHHPTFIASCRPDLFKMHASFADVFAMDPYTSSAQALEWCRRAQKEVAGDLHKPVVVIPWADSKPGDIPFQAWIAIVHDARGIIWYCWSQVGGGPSGVGIWDKPEKQAIYKELLPLIKTVQPGITSVQRRCFEAGDLHGIVGGDHPGQRYLIVLNVNENAKAAPDAEGGLAIPELKGIRTVFLPQQRIPKKDKDGKEMKDRDGKTILEDAALTITPGIFSETLAPREVRIWRF
jgi:hypothetical protein